MTWWDVLRVAWSAPVLAAVIVWLGVRRTAKVTLRVALDRLSHERELAEENRRVEAREAREARLADHRRLAYLEALDAVSTIGEAAQVCLTAAPFKISVEERPEMLKVPGVVERLPTLSAKVRLMCSDRASEMFTSAFREYLVVVYMRSYPGDKERLDQRHQMAERAKEYERRLVEEARREVMGVEEPEPSA